MLNSSDNSVKVAVRIRPLSYDESIEDNSHSVRQVGSTPQVVAGCDTTFTFDYVFGSDSHQSDVYETCVVPLVEAAFEGFNATILAYGQTGSGKTWTMGSSSDSRALEETQGIIPRVIRHLFASIAEREAEHSDEAASASVSFKIYVQFLEIYGEDIKDLLDNTHTSKVTIRETTGGDVYICGAKEELVHSPEQMMRALDEGSKFRATASTRMNQASSRSHAIFTVILEQSLYAEGKGEAEGQPSSSAPTSSSSSSAPTAGSSSGGSSGGEGGESKPEVRKCKFHFVDLAGSERAKRTGAQGQQLREGIDINKGLLALGNVISALGDETKRGKVHVPYRDSKLTRMLQDSLGGNSKTLVICCASPSAASYSESVNALRYANRARNIQNKPVVNRDLTLVLLDELKGLVRTLATECLHARGRGVRPEPDNGLPVEAVQAMAAGAKGSTGQGIGGSSGNGGSAVGVIASRAHSAPSSSTMTSTASSSSTAAPRRGSDREKERERERDRSQVPGDRSVELLRARSAEAEAETARLTGLAKQLRLQLADAQDKALLLQSEADYFKMKWEETQATRSQGASVLSPGEAGDSPDADKGKFTAMAAGYLSQIDALRRQLEHARAHSHIHSPSSRAANRGGAAASAGEAFSGGDEDHELLDADFSLSVARVIAQTREQLERDGRRLNSPSRSSQPPSPPGLLDLAGESDETRLAVVHEQAYQQRQQGMRSEVVELGESILVKERLIEQLQRSQYQYDIMKTFYEKKLHTLGAEMQAKQGERERLATELQDLDAGEGGAAAAASQQALQQRSERERSLKEALRRKDEELRALRKRQEELASLSATQSKYATQAQRLQQDVEAMKKQRVDLTRTLASEKRRHVQVLSEKANEIERLRRQLTRTAEEARRAGRDKERAEGRTREALREQGMLRRRAMDMLKLGQDGGANLSKARAARQALTTSSRQSHARILSEEEMQTKSWLDRRLAEIASREAVADSLQRQCEQQLALLSRKEALERARDQGSLGSRPSADASASSTAVASSAEGGPEREWDDGQEDLHDQIASLESQLAARQDRIADLQKLLEGVDSGTVGGAGGSVDKAVEHLRKSAASLPQAHDLLRLLFDMLVGASRLAKTSRAAQAAAELREAKGKMELDQAAQTLLVRERQHSTDLARVMRDNEERMQGLFTHSAVGAAVMAEIGLEGGVAGGASSETPTRLPAAAAGSPRSRLSFVGRPWTWNSPSIKSPNSPPNGRVSGSSPSGPSPSHADPLRSQLAILHEAHNSSRLLLDTTSRRCESLSNQLEELSAQHGRALKEARERELHVRFLEDECRMFREISDRLRQSLQQSSTDAALPARIIRQVRRAAPAQDSQSSSAPPRAVPSSVGIDSIFEEEEDDDSASMIGQYDALADEINALGLEEDFALYAAKPPSSHAPPSAAAPGVVFNRLTNPSNFTGVTKKVFEHDLASKRQKVREIKSREATSAHQHAGAASSGFSGARAERSGTGDAENAPNVPPQRDDDSPRDRDDARGSESDSLAPGHSNGAHAPGPGHARQQDIFSRLSKQFTVATSALSETEREREKERERERERTSSRDRAEQPEGARDSGGGQSSTAIARQLLGITDRLHQLSTLSHERKKKEAGPLLPPPPPSFLKR